MSRTIHMCMDIEGYLNNSSYPEGFAGMFKHDDGQPMQPADARAELFKQLRMGRRVIPLGPLCEGFDYQTGCPGHDAASSRLPEEKS